MKLKCDENLSSACVQMLLDAGHDVATVHQQHLSGATDGQVIAACRAEGRALVTLDLDFSNPLVFPPSEFTESRSCDCRRSRHTRISRSACARSSKR